MPTQVHPILANLSADEARHEIAKSSSLLSNILDKPIKLFAYPNGVPGKDYTERDARIVESLGFQCAVSTASGVSTAATDPYQLKRFTPWDNKPSRFYLRLLKNYL